MNVFFGSTEDSAPNFNSLPDIRAQKYGRVLHVFGRAMVVSRKDLLMSIQKLASIPIAVSG
jgi:hypothetical protein